MSFRPRVGAALAAAVALGCGGESAPSGPAPVPCTAFVMPPDCTIPAGAVLPGELRCTGLYGNWETREIACGVEAYAPAHELWSDGAAKQRWVSLPPGTTVDVSNPDAFTYPVGTSFWKEFRPALAGGTRLGETRLLHKSEAGWIYTSYVWSADETSAVQNNDGVENLHGSGHTVPARTQCKECHAGRPDYVLGWDALLLGAGASGLTRQELVGRGLVTWTGRAEGAPSPLEHSIPGDTTEQRALGYLHANCGVSCHNPTTPALARESGFFMHLDSAALASVIATPTFASGLDRTPNPNAPIMDLPVPASGPFVDLRPLDPERSLLLARMKLRNSDAQMPRVATNRVDDAGVALVDAWIRQMTPERGYPTPAP